MSQTLVAIDGSKFKADNNRDRNLKASKVARRLKEIEGSIERYMSRLDKEDQREPEICEIQTKNLSEKIESLKETMERIRQFEARMLETPEKQISLTDPDARSLRSRGTGVVGYNVQTAVDTQHHLIVAHEVAGEIDFRLGHEGPQAGDEVQGLEDDVGGAVAIRGLQLAADVAVGCEGKPLFRYRRPGDVTAQPFQLVPFPGFGRHTDMANKQVLAMLIPR